MYKNLKKKQLILVNNLENNKIENFDTTYNINLYINFFRKQYNVLDNTIIQSFIHYVQQLNKLSLIYFKNDI